MRDIATLETVQSDGTTKELMETILKRLKDEIIPIFENALSNGTGVSFHNPHIVTCWKTMDCKSTTCSLHGQVADATRCWQIAGTHCDGEHQGSFPEKYGKCSGCAVFKESCPSIVEEIGEHFNNMLYLFSTQKSNMLEDRQHIEHLNSELISAMEQIDRKNREIQKMMITDKLTGLFNRHHLITVLEDEIARCNRYGHPIAIMIIDIDDFRSINESCGQTAGDAILAYVGTLINENTRKFDRAFRYGSEEFIVVLPETDITLAYIVAERIRKYFGTKVFPAQEKRSLAETNISRTLSIGLTATFPYKTNTLSIEELLNQIDKALSQAKSKGGNIVIRHDQ